MRYSVVIPTYNRSVSLERTIESLVDQTAAPDEYEIIIVDDGSSDDTRGVVLAFQEKYPSHQIVYYYQKNRGSAAAKNAGIKIAQGEIILFTDDDCVVPPNWIEVMAKGYNRFPEVVGVSGFVSSSERETRFFQKTAFLLNKLLNQDYFNDGKERILDSPGRSLGICPNVSYRKKVLEEVGGFDENASALGSVELKYRVMNVHRKKILFIPIAVINNCPLNFWQYVKKYIRQGRCKYYLNKKYPDEVVLYHALTFHSRLRRINAIMRRIRSTHQLSLENTAKIYLFLVIEGFLNILGGFLEKHFPANVYNSKLTPA